MSAHNSKEMPILPWGVNQEMEATNAAIYNNPPVTLNMSAGGAAMQAGSSAGMASKPMIDVLVNGNSDELSDTRYLNKLLDVASANCYAVNFDLIKDASNGDIDMMTFENGPRTLFGFKLEDIQPYRIIIENGYPFRELTAANRISANNPEFIKAMTDLSMPYILHGLLGKKLAPCIRNNRMPAALVSHDPKVCDFGGKISVQVMPVNFIESLVDIPKEKNGQFNIRSVRDMILSVECK